MVCLAHNSPDASNQTGGSWDTTVAAWRADNPTYQVIPQVDVYGKRETAEQQLIAAFGLDKKVAFSQANPSRIEAQQSVWSSYANIAGAYRNGQIGLGDAAAMAWDNTKFAYQGSQRTQGAVQAINGGLEVAGAAAISGTGVGAMVGLPLAFHGGDNFGTGLRRLWTGEPQNTVTYNGVEALTGSRNAAAFVDKAIPFAGGAAGAALAVNMGTNAVVFDGTSLPLHPRASVSNVTAREFYLEGERQIASLNDFLTSQPLSAEERAIELVNTRNALRSETRSIMGDQELASFLNATDPNLTVEQLIQKNQLRGLSGNEMWEEIARSAARSRPSVNQNLGVRP